MSNVTSRSREDHVVVVEELLIKTVEQLEGDFAASLRHDAAVSMAAFIVDSMSTPYRVYHTMEHIMEIVQEIQSSYDVGKHAVPILAALFHDVVYLTVDPDLSKEQKEVLSAILQDVNDSKSLKLQTSTNDPLIQIVQSIFGFELRPGQGYNEYVSALVAIKMLSEILSPKHLVQVVACIEASIPFRPTIDSATPMDALYARVRQTNRDCSLGLSEIDLVETVQMAALFSNCDLGAFCQRDVSIFLDNTWKLLPEWKPELLSETCQLQDIYDALLLLYGRYQSTNVQLLFQQFHNVPLQTDLEGMRHRATANLQVVGAYISIRLLQMHVLLELVKIATPDAPNHVEDAIATCVAGSAVAFVRLVDSKVEPQLEGRRSNDPRTDDRDEQQVYAFLKQGRCRTSFDWDTAESPLAAFLCCKLMFDAAVELGTRAANGEHVLDLLPTSVLKELVTILSEIFPEFGGAKWQDILKGSDE